MINLINIFGLQCLSYRNPVPSARENLFQAPYSVTIAHRRCRLWIQLIKAIAIEVLFRVARKHLVHPVVFNVCGVHVVIIGVAGIKSIIKMRSINATMASFGKMRTSLARKENIVEMSMCCFRQIIVRPQWIQRVSGTPNSFRAQYRANEDEDLLLSLIHI